jgi:hypothetical protein
MSEKRQVSASRRVTCACKIQHNEHNNLIRTIKQQNQAMQGSNTDNPSSPESALPFGELCFPVAAELGFVPLAEPDPKPDPEPDPAESETSLSEKTPAYVSTGTLTRCATAGSQQCRSNKASALANVRAGRLALGRLCKNTHSRETIYIAATSTTSAGQQQEPTTSSGLSTSQISIMDRGASDQMNTSSAINPPAFGGDLVLSDSSSMDSTCTVA